MRRAVATCILVLVVAGLPAARAADLAASVLVGTVVKVKDGDSLVVRLEGGPAGSRANDLGVRLHGVDAPEYQQAGGAAATQFLKRRVLRKRVEISPVTMDRYDRMVGVVTESGRNVNAELVAGGHAWAYRRYLAEVPGAEDFCRLEAEARGARRGLWAAPPATWVPPWRVRKTRGTAPGEMTSRSYADETEARCRQAIPRARGAGRAASLAAAPGGDEQACRIKGNINSRGERIYHLPGSPGYANTRIDTRAGERWFCTEAEAQAAGWRPPR